MKTAIDLILESRDIFKRFYGFSAELEDLFINEELASAAYCYAMPDKFKEKEKAPDNWPWNILIYHKAQDDSIDARILKLSESAGFIIAEIERLQRLKQYNK